MLNGKLIHSEFKGSMDSPNLTRRKLIRVQALNASLGSVNWSGSQPQLNVKEEPEDSTYPTIVVPQGRLTFPIAVTAFVSTFGSSFPHGWNTGVLNAPSHIIQAFINKTMLVRTPGEQSSDTLLNFLWAFTMAIYLVGGCFGAFSVGCLADKLGRKKAILVCHTFNFVAAVLFAFARDAVSFEMLIFARFIVGFGCGAGSGLVPMYLTEIAPVNYRGAMGVLHQFALTCGIFFSQAFGLRQILGNEEGWPILLALTALPSLVSLLILPWFPESPRFLYVNQNNEAAAEKALKIFRGTDDVLLDMQEMRSEVDAAKMEPKWSFKQLLSSHHLHMPLLLVCALAMCQQLSGINVVFYYSKSVFILAGIPEDMIQYAVLVTGIINVLMTAISVPLMEKSGRRPLLLGGIVGMVLSAIAITVSLLLQDLHYWMAYLCIVCIGGFIIGFSIGLGSIPQFIGGEIFKQGPRPPAMSIAGFLNWLCNFLVAILYPFIQMSLGAYSFIIFIAFLIVFGVFLAWKLPETKNRSYEEIARLFRSPGGHTGHGTVCPDEQQELMNQPSLMSEIGTQTSQEESDPVRKREPSNNQEPKSNATSPSQEKVKSLEKLISQED